MMQVGPKSYFFLLVVQSRILDTFQPLNLLFIKTGEKFIPIIQSSLNIKHFFNFLLPAILTCFFGTLFDISKDRHIQNVMELTLSVSTHLQSVLSTGRKTGFLLGEGQRQRKRAEPQKDFLTATRLREASENTFSHSAWQKKEVISAKHHLLSHIQCQNNGSIKLRNYSYSKRPQNCAEALRGQWHKRKVITFLVSMC